MTVSYTAQVASSNFGCFLKLLARWRGSIYKIIWLDLFVFLLLYYTLNMSYRYVMNENGRHFFELLIHYCHSSSTLIPLSFVLGFYVTIVMQRWWAQYMTVPWPDPLAVYVSTLFVGQDERGRVMRRTMMRYVCLCLTMVFTMVSPCVKKRFPTMEHLIEAGLLTENESDVLKKMDAKSPKHKKHWVPLVWASSIVSRARKEGRIRDDVSLKTIFDELDAFRNKCATILHYDSVPIPLVYTQVVTLAVYSYFLAAIIGQQYTETIDEDGHYNLVDYYFPIFTMLEFFFYMGWLKVAESLSNPFGEGDDDFEINWMIDRNLQVTYLIVDEMHHEHPELVRDQYWEEVLPEGLPYPPHLPDLREDPPQPSTAYMEPEKINGDDSTVRFVWKRRDNNISSFHSSISLINATLKRLLSVEDGGTSTGRARHSPASISSRDSENMPVADSNHVVTNYSRPTRRDWQKENTALEAEPGAYKLEGQSSERSRVTSKGSEPKSRGSEGEGEDEGEEEGEGEDEDEDEMGSDENEKDDFELLREERERQRLERQRQRIMQNVFTATSATAGLTPDQLPVVILSGTFLSQSASMQLQLQQQSDAPPPSEQPPSATPSENNVRTEARDGTERKVDSKTEQK